jgi:hypothetical protein
LRARAAILAALVSVSISVASRPASAEATAAEKAMAEGLFAHGKQLLAAGRPTEACPKFAASERLDPQVGTLLFLATCHEQEGKTAAAYAEFTDALALLGSLHQPGRVQYARERLAALSGRLSRVAVISSSTTAGLEVRLDGTALDHGALGTMLPVDPGEHRIEATAPGKQPWSRSVSVARGPSEQTITVPPLADVAEPTTEETHAPVAPAPVAPARGGGITRPLAYGLGAVGIVGLGVGAVFGVRTITKKNEADDGECAGSFCSPRGLDLYSDAHTASTTSTIAFVVGASALAISAVLLLVGDGTRKTASHRRMLIEW